MKKFVKTFSQHLNEAREWDSTGNIKTEIVRNGTLVNDPVELADILGVEPDDNIIELVAYDLSCWLGRDPKTSRYVMFHVPVEDFPYMDRLKYVQEYSDPNTGLTAEKYYISKPSGGQSTTVIIVGDHLFVSDEFGKNSSGEFDRGDSGDSDWHKGMLAKGDDEIRRMHSMLTKAKGKGITPNNRRIDLMRGEFKRLGLDDID